MEAEPQADRHAEEPEPDNVVDHRPQGVGNPAKRTRAHHLQTVDELEHSRHRDEHGSHGDHLALSAERRRQLAGPQEEDRRRNRHDDDADQQRAAAVPPSALRPLRSHGPAHQHRGSLGNPQRNHEGEGGQVQRDLMTRHRFGPEPSHHYADCAEGPELQEQMAPDRRAQAHHPPQGRPPQYIAMDPPEVGRQKAQRETQNAQAHEPAGDGGGPSGADRTQGRGAQVPEDQYPVREDVQQVGEDDRPHDRRHPAHCLQDLAKDDEAVERPHTGDQRMRIARRGGNHLPGLAQ